MKKAFLVSFYNSSNLGDLELSSSIDKLIVDKGYEILKYDFTSGEKYPNSKLTPPPSIAAPEKLTLSNLFLLIKRIIIFFIGKYKYEMLIWKFISKRKWRRNNNLYQDIKKCDIVVLAGGNMVMDLTSTWPQIIKYYIDTAQSLKKEVYIMYVGVGPIVNIENKEVLRKSFQKISKISVRDRLSYNLTKEFTDENKIVSTVDPVFDGAINLDERLKKSKDVNNIAICIINRECFRCSDDYEFYVNTIINITEEISKRRNTKIFLFSTERSDYDSVKFVYEKISSEKKEIFLNNIYTIDDLYSFYDNIDFLIGGRMHSMILAQKRLVPFLSIIWQDKIKGFAEVTQTQYKMYSLSEIENKIDEIVELVFTESKNSEISFKMNEENFRLKELVEKGNVLI